MLCPSSADELAAALLEASSRKQAIRLGGLGTKRMMGGPLMPADVEISTARMNRVLQYEPRDLTISVEAGLPFAELARTLAEHKQMVPLDPPWFEHCTVGGVVAANVSGPRRRLYGTARDAIIGMRFVTVEGTVVETGGTVVKNVAGLDMGKLMVGSFGTLAAIASVNFRLHPIPPQTRTFVQQFASAAAAVSARDGILNSQLQPSAIDIVKSGGVYRLAVQAGGSAAVLDRYTRDLGEMEIVEGDAEAQLWREIREFTPEFLATHPEGAVARVSCPLTEVARVLESFPARALARAGNGVCYGYFDDWRTAGNRGVIEYAPQAAREKLELWPIDAASESNFAMMKKVKEMFDPQYLLNRRRLYGRL